MKTNTNTDLEKRWLANRLFVAREEQRATDGRKYGEHMYAPMTLEECYVELWGEPIPELQASLNTED